MVKQTRLNDDGGIQLPPELRQRFGWQAGDQLTIEELDDGMLVRRADITDAAALGEAGRALAAEVISPEDFSDWDHNGG